MECYFQSALSPNTQRTYSSAQNRYLRFCTQANIVPFSVVEHHLCQFAVRLAHDKVAHSSIKGYLSAVRRLQIAQGLPDPLIASMPKLEGVIRGIKVTQARAGSPKKNRLPITPSILSSIRLQWEKLGSSQDHTMLWAAVTLLFWLPSIWRDYSPRRLHLRPCHPSDIRRCECRQDHGPSDIKGETEGIKD